MAKQLTIHPLCAAWPEIEGEEFDRLVQSIKDGGLAHPVVTYNYQIIDGKNRLRACRAAGVHPNFKEWYPRDDEPIEPQLLRFVLACNEHRRHLTASQRAMIAAKLVTTDGKGRPEENAQNCAFNQADAADAMSVSRRSVQSAADVLANADPEVIAAVEHGDVSVADAAEIADAPKKVQRKAVRQVRGGKAATLKEAAGDKVSPPKALRDHDGTEVPETKTLRAAFESRTLFHLAEKARAVLAERCLEISRMIPDGKLFMQSADTSLSRLFEVLEKHEPFRLCPACGGKKPTECKRCRGRGYQCKH